MRTLAAAVILMCVCAPLCQGLADNVVVQWNSALQRTIRKLSIANQISSRYLSQVQLAQYQVKLLPSTQFAAVAEIVDY